MKSKGSRGARQWLSVRYTGSRSSTTWIDLWTLATGVDYRLSSCADEEELIRTLAADDLMELALRRLAAYAYEVRSGDKRGATHMMGVMPPGGQGDIAPAWLVQSATNHSKLEHQRRERAEAELLHPDRGGRSGEGDKGDKGRGRGRGRGGAEGASQY